MALTGVRGYMITFVAVTNKLLPIIYPNIQKIIILARLVVQQQCGLF